MKQIIEFDSGVKLDASKERIIVVSSDGKKFEFDKNGAFIEPDGKIIRKPSSRASRVKSRTWDVFDYIKQGHYVDYTPDIAEFVLDSKYTGTERAQHIKTEENTIWRVFYVDKKNDRIIITTQGTVNEVTLCGKVGYERGPEGLHLLCEECYSNRRLGIKASSMVVDDVNRACKYKVKGKANNLYWYNPKDYNELVAEILGNTYGWLASPCVDLYSSNARFYVRSANSSNVRARYLYYSDGSTNSYSGGVRPIVSLCSGLFADVVEKNGIGTSKEKAWKLISD